MSGVGIFVDGIEVHLCNHPQVPCGAFFHCFLRGSSPRGPPTSHVHWVQILWKDNLLHSTSNDMKSSTRPVLSHTHHRSRYMDTKFVNCTFTSQYSTNKCVQAVQQQEQGKASWIAPASRVAVLVFYFYFTCGINLLFMHSTT